MTALLRKPGGFEGVRPARKARAANELAVLDRPHLPEGELRLCATLPPASAKGRSHYDLVASIDQLVDFGPSIVELASQPTHELLVSLGSVKDTGAVGDYPGGGIPTVWGKVRNRPIDVSPAVSLKALRNISDWLEGARSGAIGDRSGRPYKPSSLRGYSSRTWSGRQVTARFPGLTSRWLSHGPRLELRNPGFTGVSKAPLPGFEPGFPAVRGRRPSPLDDSGG